MRKNMESGPALLDETPQLNALTDAAADALDLMKDASATKQDKWQAFERLELTLLETADLGNKIPGEDEAFEAYKILANAIGVDPSDYKVFLNKDQHLQSRPPAN